MSGNGGDPKAYWRASLRIVFGILLVWAFIAFGCGIFLKEKLDAIKIGGAPFGFWMAQQGGVICFISLLVVYTILMNRLDKKHGYDEEEKK